MIRPHPVLFEDALIHHHEDARPAPLLRSSLIHHAFLRPDGRHLELDRLLHDRLEKL
jgi:hypothetical protein